MAYVVMVDDHFHYMDPEERYKSGEFADVAQALARCRRIVDDYLTASLAAPNAETMTASELWDSYTSFGEDPFIVATAGDAPVAFSAWNYARSQCEARCGGVIPEPQQQGSKDVGL